MKLRRLDSRSYVSVPVGLPAQGLNEFAKDDAGYQLGSIAGKAARANATNSRAKAWARACVAAGVPVRLVHDLRRTAARDFRRTGVSEREIMKLCGWKTRDMFERCNIIDASDLSRGVAQLFNSKQRQTIQ